MKTLVINYTTIISVPDDYVIPSPSIVQCEIDDVEIEQLMDVLLVPEDPEPGAMEAWDGDGGEWERFALNQDMLDRAWEHERG